MQKEVAKEMQISRGEYAQLIDDIIASQDFSDTGCLIDTLMSDLPQGKYDDVEMSIIRYIISLYLST